MKIIHIGDLEYSAIHPTVPDLEAKFYSSWSTRFARNTLNYTKKYKHEIWTIYDPKSYGDYGVATREEPGIVYKLFPGKKLTHKYISFPMIEELIRVINSNEKVLIHSQSVHNTFMNYIIAGLCKNVPFVCQQRGPTSPPMWKFRFHKHPFFYLSSYVDNYFVKNYYDFVFASSIGETKYISKKYGKNKVMHLKGGGFSFDKYKINSKLESRKKLGLDPEKNYLLHIGRYSEVKGVDLILEVYKKLKKENNIGMVFVGGSNNDKLYKDVVNSGAVVEEYINKTKVLEYIRATDIHLLPTQDKKWIPFGDIPNSIIESLSLNQPVITPMLVHFSGSLRERKKLGIMANNGADLEKSIKYILKNYDYFTDTRNIMKKYYSWDRVLEKNIKEYERLFDAYYN